MKTRRTRHFQTTHHAWIVCSGATELGQTLLTHRPGDAAACQVRRIGLPINGSQTLAGARAFLGLVLAASGPGSQLWSVVVLAKASVEGCCEVPPERFQFWLKHQHATNLCSLTRHRVDIWLDLAGCPLSNMRQREKLLFYLLALGPSQGRSCFH